MIVRQPTVQWLPILVLILALLANIALPVIKTPNRKTVQKERSTLSPVEPMLQLANRARWVIIVTQRVLAQLLEIVQPATTVLQEQ
jgi:hypothetical protein